MSVCVLICAWMNKQMISTMNEYLDKWTANYSRMHRFLVADDVNHNIDDCNRMFNMLS